MRDCYAHLVAVADVRSVGRMQNDDDMCRVNLAVMSCNFSISVPKSLVKDKTGVQLIKQGSVVYVKGRLTNDSNVKTFDGHSYSASSFVMDIVEEFRLATKEEM